MGEVAAYIGVTFLIGAWALPRDARDSPVLVAGAGGVAARADNPARVSHLQGWAAVALGISILPIVFTTVAPDELAGGLVVFACVANPGGVALYLFSTWLSRRPA